jgi:hypothetical protein
MMLRSIYKILKEEVEFDAGVATPVPAVAQ